MVSLGSLGRVVNRMVPKLLFILLILGIVLVFRGQMGLQNVFNSPNNVPASSSYGLALFASHYPTLAGNYGITSTRVAIMLYGIRPDLNATVLSITCNFQTQFNSSEIVFGAQIPYNSSSTIPDWNVSVGLQTMGTPRSSFRGGSIEYNSRSPNPNLAYFPGFDIATGLSYFWVRANRTMNHNTYYDFIWFNATIILKTPLIHNSYSTYELINRFDYGPAIENIVPGPITDINPFNSVSYVLDVAQPAGSIIQSSPTEYNISASGRNLWYQWDIKKLSSPVASGSIVLVDFQITDLVTRRDQTIFFSSLDLGVGIPLIISSIVELLKLGKPASRKRK
jgi:hypothetical protein